MKRSHESCESSDESLDDIPAKKANAEKISESTILADLHKNLSEEGDMNQFINQRLFEAQKQYYRVYMEKLLKQIPMGQQLVDIVTHLGETTQENNGFEYTFTAAKSAIQSSMRVKQIKALQAIFDMVYGLGMRYVHDHMVTPALKPMIQSQKLEEAYNTYKRFTTVEEDGSVLELQCLLFCIQEDIQKTECCKVVNPVYSRLTQQMKAMSEYVIALLTSAATSTEKNPPIVEEVL